MKSSLKFKVFFPILAIFVLLLLLVPRSAKWGYEYTKGQTWRYDTLVAQFDFPLLKTREQIAAELSERSAYVIPFYKLSTSISGDCLRNMESLEFEGDSLGLKASAIRHLAEIFYKGVLPDDSVESELIYVQRDKRAEKLPSSEVYHLPQARVALLGAVSLDCEGRVNVDSLFRANYVYELIVPNLVYDEQLTALVQSRNEASVSTTMGYVNAGTIIVNSGELITAELEQVLDSYKAEYEHSFGSDKPMATVWLANALLLIAILVCLFYAIYFSNPMIFKDYNRYLYILTVFALMTATELIFISCAPDWIFLFPFTVGALYLQAFFRTRVIYPVYIVSLLPLLLYADNGPALFMIYL
ncbi:MAG: hypothetical protein ACI4TL_05975, partial [Candidatus Cryptobacteroides sp.]